MPGRVAAHRLGASGRLLSAAIGRSRQWGRPAGLPEGERSGWESLAQAAGDLGEGVVVLERGRPMHVSAVWAATLGYAPEELLSMASLAPLLLPDQREAGVALLGQEATTRDGHRFPMRLLTKDGRTLSVEIAARALGGRGSPRVILLLRDVTASGKSEQLRAMQVAITRILSLATNFEAGAPRIIETVARALGMLGGEAWLLDPDRGLLTRRACWWTPSINAGAFDQQRWDLGLKLGRDLPDRKSVV